MAIDRAKKVFDRFGAYLKKTDWKYDTDTEGGRLVILSSAVGDDLPIKLIIHILPDRELIMLNSPLPFKFDKDHKVVGAVATSMINNSLIDGCFDYNFNEGSVSFRMATSFLGAEIGEEVFEYLIVLTCTVVDKYNDKLLMVSKGVLGMEELDKIIVGE